MADDNSISYSYQSGENQTATKAGSNDSFGLDLTLYAFADCARVDLLNGAVMLIDRHSDKQMIVSPEVSFTLASCTTFRTLQHHVNVLTETVPQLAGQQDNVRQVLEMVREAGLLTTAEQTCERLCPDNVTPAVDLPATRVFIITCDRPQAVERLLESMLFAGSLTRHEHLFLIDDSRDESNAAQNRELASQFNIRSPKNIQYVGSKEQATMMNALLAGLPQHEPDIRFLMDRDRWKNQKSYGLARNLCLLLSVGCRAIVMDDDIICAAVEPPHKKEGLHFGDTPREVEFYSSQQDILNRTVKTDFDPLSGHAECLGLNLAQAIEKLGTDKLTAIDLQDANAAFLNQWHADSNIIITQTGSIGDPGTADTRWVYTLDKNSSRRVLESAGGLDSALVNREYWMGQPSPQFTKMAVISQMTGLNNSQLLPPYFPVFRGEDYLFGAMVEFLHPDSAVLEYNWSVPHFPLEVRKGTVTNPPLGAAGKINLSKYVTDKTRYEAGCSVETRLEALSLMVKELGETSDKELVTLYRKEVAEAQGREQKKLVSALQAEPTKPIAWQSYLQESLQEVARNLQQVAHVTDTASIPDDLDEAEILRAFKDYCLQYAGSIGSWRAVRDASVNITTELIDAKVFMP